MMPCAICGHEICQSAKDEKKSKHAANVNGQGPYCSLCFHLEFALRHANLRNLGDVSYHIQAAQTLYQQP